MVVWGKPHPTGYRIALQRMMATFCPRASHPPSPPGLVFMVGDNPATDIQGANAFGQPLCSVLVQSPLVPSDAALRALSDSMRPRVAVRNVVPFLHALIAHGAALLPQPGVYA